jgi:hypothetical protein
MLNFTRRFVVDLIQLKGANDVYCLLPSIGVTVSIHDSTFASVATGPTPDSPMITRGDDNPVTAAQASAVLDLIRVQGKLFSWTDTFSLPGSCCSGRSSTTKKPRSGITTRPGTLSRPISTI